MTILKTQTVSPHNQGVKYAHCVCRIAFPLRFKSTVYAGRYTYGDIMRLFLIFLILLVSACSTQTEQNDESKPDYSANNAKYESLVQKIKSSATKDDFEEIRRVYILTEYYKPYFGGETSLGTNMFEALGNKNWDNCIENAETILSTNYLSLNAHYGAMVCLYELNDQQKADHHKLMLNGFLDAIWATGDGKSEETAFHTISTSELRSFLHIQGLEIEQQSLIQGKNNMFDLMNVKDTETGKKFGIYFNISAQMIYGFKGLD